MLDDSKRQTREIVQRKHRACCARIPVLSGTRTGMIDIADKRDRKHMVESVDRLVQLRALLAISPPAFTT